MISSPSRPLTGPDPAAIAEALSKRILGQDEAIREMAVALSKQIAGLRVGNILMVGSSGTGKTTLMRGVESYLASDPVLKARSTVIRRC
jgi:ATP-dependent Clp protease ATP-binding subunit ClpA